MAECRSAFPEGDSVVSELIVDCPVPHPPGEQVLLGHGEGARLTRRLIRDTLLDAFSNEYLRQMGDGAVLPMIDGAVVVSTDSYVVSPLFFPGGDIGTLAVYGTINDLAVCGALPLYLTLGLILEEGLPMATLHRVIVSIAGAARSCGVAIVTGDTKVVPRGAADGLFVNTTGIGRLRAGIDLGRHRVTPGDRILVSGTIADHGIAILSAREGLEMDAACSDTASIFDLVQSLFDAGIDVHFLRDPTRGGVSAVMHEIAEMANVSILLKEVALPLTEAVRGACEILGLDPLYIANEGKLVAIVGPDESEKALHCLRQHPLGKRAEVIGEVMPVTSAPVVIRNAFGSLRVLDEPSGALLPRIC
jgi:hydrogenase expression/formation protein HypE